MKAPYVRSGLFVMALVFMGWACSDELTDIVSPPEGMTVEFVAGEWPDTAWVGDTLVIRYSILASSGSRVTGLIPTFEAVNTDTVDVTNSVPLVFPDTITDPAWSAYDSTWAAVVRPGPVQITANVAGPNIAPIASSHTLGSYLSRVAFTSPDTTLGAIEDTARLSAVAYDLRGNPVDSAGLSWSRITGTGLRLEHAPLADTALMVADTAGVATVEVAHDYCAGSGPCADTVQVRVQQIPVDVEVNPDTHVFNARGSTVDLTDWGRVVDSNGHSIGGLSVEWRPAGSADSAVVSVGPGDTLRADTVGTATVEAIHQNLVDTLDVTVRQIADSIAIAPALDTLNALGDTVRLTAWVFDANGYVVPGVHPTWEVDTLTMHEVAVGEYEGLGVGLQDVVVSYEDGTVPSEPVLVVDTARVLVRQVPKTLAISPATDTLNALGDTITFSVTASDSNDVEIADAEPLCELADSTVVGRPEPWIPTPRVEPVLSRAPGLAALACALDGVVDTATVLVRQIAAELVADPPSRTINALRDTAEISGEVRDSNGVAIAPAVPDRVIGDTTVLRPLSDDRVEAVAVGSTFVGFTYVDSTNLNGVITVVDTVPITVRQVVDSLSCALGGDFNAIGDTVEVSVTVQDSNGFDIPYDTVRWDFAVSGIVDAVEPVCILVEGFVCNAVNLVAVSPGSTPAACVVDGQHEAFSVISWSQIAASFSIAPSADTLNAKYDTLQLTIAAADSNGHAVQAPAIVWSTSDSAKVELPGSASRLVGVDTGTITIWGELDAIVDSVEVHIRQVPGGVTVDPALDTVAAIMDTLQLTALLADSNRYPIEAVAANWTVPVADMAVLVVLADGRVVAKGPGFGRVEGNYSGWVDTATVVVAQVPASVEMPLADTMNALMDTLELQPVAFDSNSYKIEGAMVECTSSNTSVVKILDACRVEARDTGHADVIGAVDAVQGVAEIYVRQIPGSVVVLPSDTTFNALMDTISFAAQVADSNGYAIGDVAPTWSATDPDTVRVLSDGRAIAQLPGTGGVVATYQSWADTATALVRQVAETLVLTPRDTVLKSLSDTVALKLLAKDSNEFAIPEPPVTCTSLTPDVVQVLSDCRVVAVAGGSGRVGGSLLDAADTMDVTVDQVPSPATSAVSADPDSIPNDGATASTITIRLKDARGNALLAGGDNVTGSQDRADALSDFVDQGNGTYLADMTSTAGGLTTVTAYVNGQRISDQAEVSVIAPPAAPVDLSATAVSGSRINVTWDASNITNELGFIVERCQDTECVEFTRPANSESFIDEPLESATAYGYTVTAFNIAGEESAGPVYATTYAGLTVVINGDGDVTSNPSGVSCPGTCTAYYPIGTPITLSAAADYGWHFDDWSGCDTATGCQIDLDSNRTAVVTFAKNSYTLSFSKSGNGTVSSSPSGIYISSTGSSDSGTFTYDEGVTITANPSSGYEITDWSGDCNSTADSDNTCSLTIDGNMSAGVAFGPIQRTVCFTKSGNGTVTSSPSGIYISTSGTYDCGTFDDGENITITASASSGWVIGDWSGACNGTMDDTCTIYGISSDRSAGVTFNYNMEPAYIELNANSNSIVYQTNVAAWSGGMTLRWDDAAKSIEYSSTCGWYVFILKPDGLDDKTKIWLDDGSGGLDGLSNTTSSISVTVKGMFMGDAADAAFAAYSNHNSYENEFTAHNSTYCAEQTRTLYSSYFSTYSTNELYLGYADHKFGSDVDARVRSVRWTFNDWLVPQSALDITGDVTIAPTAPVPEQ